MENNPANAVMLKKTRIYYFHLNIELYVKQSHLLRYSQEIYLFGNKFNVLFH